MKRLAIFSHYDKHNLIDDYVVYYLNGLKEVCDDIVFVSDCNLNAEQLEKIEGLVIKIITGKHGEYDFGSYKRGFFATPNTGEYDEIVFCNDSCYGPLYPLSEMFDDMSTKNIDFWGVTQNNFSYEKINGKYKMRKNKPHVQSFFFLIKKNVFASQEFKDFLFKVKKEEDKRDVIINYEEGLTRALEEKFSVGSFVPIDRKCLDLTVFKWKQLVLKYRCPLLKVKVAKIAFGVKVVARTGYQYVLIKKHVRRTRSRKDRVDRVFRVHRGGVRVLGIYFRVRP